jgi:hypothetical protein
MVLFLLWLVSHQPTLGQLKYIIKGLCLGVTGPLSWLLSLDFFLQNKDLDVNLQILAGVTPELSDDR